MKRSVSRMIAAALLATALVVPAIAFAGEGAKGGAAQLMKPLRTPAEVKALETDDLVVMACPKCKSTYITRVETPPKGSQPTTTVVEQHQCPGCSAKVQIKGGGKSKKGGVMHVCRNCGSKSAFCCAIKPGALPTPGMQK